MAESLAYQIVVTSLAIELQRLDKRPASSMLSGCRPLQFADLMILAKGSAAPGGSSMVRDR